MTTTIENRLNKINTATAITISFPVQGTRLPADHGFALYSAVSRIIPELHEAEDFGIELISGVSWDKGLIQLPARGALLKLRLPADSFGKVLPLAGKRLEIEGHFIRLGIPLARPLLPAPSLYARIVTIRPFTEPEPFLDAAQKQLDTLGVKARIELPRPETNRYRRIVTIHGKKIVGFSLVAHDLSDEDSLTLQAVGIGGRRKMGCGLFNPIVSKTTERGGKDEV